MQRAEILDLSAALLAVVLLVRLAVDRVGAARTLLTVVFAFCVPGRAIVSRFAGVRSAFLPREAGSQSLRNKAART
jgi:hypothetical protein